jgi:hypothetical protein
LFSGENFSRVIQQLCAAKAVFASTWDGKIFTASCLSDMVLSPLKVEIFVQSSDYRVQL